MKNGLETFQRSHRMTGCSEVTVINRRLHSPVVGGLGASNGKLSVKGLLEFGRPMKNYMGIGIAIGVGVGTALGVALHNVPVWVAAGGAFGVILGLLMNGRNRNSN